jgi:hypothetical protein
MAEVKDGFNKLQWSNFITQSKQVVVRSNDLDEFFDLIEKVEKKYAAKPETNKDAPPFARESTTRERVQEMVDEEPNTKICKEHGVTMYKKNGTTGIFYSHWDKINGYCSGRGYKNERKI